MSDPNTCPHCGYSHPVAMMVTLHIQAQHTFRDGDNL